MKVLRFMYLCFFLGLSSPLFATTAGPFGVGIALINPSGLSANYYYRDYNSFALALGWGLRDFHLHVDHLWYRKTPLVIDGIGLDTYIGIGMRMERVAYRFKDDEMNVSVRVPGGVAYRWKELPLQVFGELGPALNLIRETFLLVDVTIGARYYF